MTITILRPTVDEKDGAWLDELGGTSLFAHVADNSDTTHIKGTAGYPADGYQATLLMGDIAALDADERVMRVRVRARYRKSVGGETPDERATVSLLDTHTRTRTATQNIRGQTSSMRDITFPWWTNAMLPGAVGWGQTPATTTTLINRLAFNLHAYNNYAGLPTHLLIVELYCDVDIHTQVTLTGPTVTGEAASARPTVSWGYVTNADLDPQRSYQVKVFTLAQTTAAGFNAASSQAVWDSGTVRSTATEVVTGIGLVNGAAYKAYVRVASDFNSTDWWTAYSASSTFTMNYVPPPTPTLTVTPETTPPSLRNLLVVNTKMNLLNADDSSHELTVGSWTANANCAVAQSATQALDGLQSMRLTATAGGDMSAITLGGAFVYPVTPGQQYTYATHLRAGTTSRTVRVKILWTDALGNTITTVTGGNFTDINSGWQTGTPVWVIGTAPNNAHGVRFVVEVLAAAAGEIHYEDKGFFHTGASTVWTPPLQKTDTWGFATRLDRTVIEFLDWAMPTSDSPNLINPNIATGGEAYGDTHGYARRSEKDMVEVDRTGTKQRRGEACIRWIVGEITNSVLDVGTAQGAYSSFTEVPTATLPGVPGRQYTLSQFIRALAGSGHSVALAAQPIDTAGAAVGSAIVGSTVEVATTMVPLQVTYTVPAGAAGVRGEIRNLDSSATTFYFDDAQLEEGATRTEWRRPAGLITGWQPVRGALTGLVANVRDGFATIHDREAPPGVIRMYRAWTEVTFADGETSRSAFTDYVPTQIDPFGGEDAILKDPQQPAWDTMARIQELGESIDEDRVESHPIRPNDRQLFGQRPVILSDWISGKNGQMSIFVDNDETWLALQAMLHTPRTLLLQFPEGGQRYIRLKARSWPKEAKGNGSDGVAYWRRIVVDFTEQARPVVTA